MSAVFTNGDKLVGRLGRVTSNEFALNPDKKETGSPREIAFADVRSVKARWTTGEKWLLAGVIYVAVTALSAVLGK